MVIILILSAVIHFILPIIAAVVVWFLPGSLIYAGIAFLVVDDTATFSKEIAEQRSRAQIANSTVYGLGTFPLDRVGSLHSNQTVSRLCETKDLHRFQRPKIQDYKAATHDCGHE